jgi:hypothetical protein
MEGPAQGAEDLVPALSSTSLLKCISLRSDLLGCDRRGSSIRREDARCLAQVNCADIECHRCGKTSNWIPADCSLVRSAFPMEDAVVTWPELGGRSSYAKHKAASLIILEVSV